MASPHNLPAIDATRCSGCGWCIAACPLHLLGFENKGWTKVSVLLDSAPCTGCSKCEVKCPINAITMRETVMPGADGVAPGKAVKVG